ncbi:protein Spindly [Anopheles moucheti]|uniref:protein Spindly n=1 Tax=Anopheles moucheti TaxID=186751 RepID=UPI0022F11794|nr:protein Spindly [Anopheles moucheti]XP_052900849.1 protein Spindly [Anopheles moucheti]
MENELHLQELHDALRKLDIAKKIIADLTNEIEQQEGRFSQEINEVRKHCENQIKSYETTIAKLREEIEEKNDIINQPILAVPKAPTIVQADTSLVKDLEAKEAQQLEEISLLKEKLATIGQDFSQAQWKISELSEEVELLKERFVSQKANLQLKTQQATELQELLESTQEQNGRLSAELAEIRSDPSNAKKGNSLFAEVADQRKSMMKKITQMKACYYELKREHENCPRQIWELRNMQQHSENLYKECITQIKSAEHYNLNTLQAQNNDLHEQVEKTKCRIRYLENQLATKSDDWVNKLIVYNREEMDKLQTRLRSYQFKQREAMELHEGAVKETFKWRIEAQRLKMKSKDMKVPCAPPLSSAGEFVTSGLQHTQTESQTKAKEDLLGATYASHDDSSGVASCATIAVDGLAAPLPMPGEDLQELKPKQEQIMDKIKTVHFKCYKISDMIAKHKEQEKAKGGTNDPAAKPMPE